MSQENVELVKRAVEAVNQRDIEGYLACCTEDVQLVTPVADVGGTYDGPDGIRRFFTDIGDAAPDFKIVIESLEAVGPDRVLGFMRVVGTGRASGIPIENATGNVYDVADGRIQRILISSTAIRPSKPPGCGSRALTSRPAIRLIAPPPRPSRSRSSLWCVTQRPCLGLCGGCGRLNGSGSIWRTLRATVTAGGRGLQESGDCSRRSRGCRLQRADRGGHKRRRRRRGRHAS
jgi:hypothetical protein